MWKKDWKQFLFSEYTCLHCLHQPWRWCRSTCFEWNCCQHRYEKSPKNFQFHEKLPRSSPFSLVVTSHELLPRFKKMLNSLPHIKTIVYMEDQLQKTSTSDFKPDVNIVGFRNVVANVSSKFISVLM